MRNRLCYVSTLSYALRGRAKGLHKMQRSRNDRTHPGMLAHEVAKLSPNVAHNGLCYGALLREELGHALHDIANETMVLRQELAR